VPPLLAPTRAVAYGWKAGDRPRVVYGRSDRYNDARRPEGGSLSELSESLFFCSIMILPQVHLRKPCYDFCPVQATAIKAVSTEAKARKPRQQQSPLFSKRLSPGQRRAVCTKGRDVINASL
jgi:hypothetical protein